MRAGRLRRQRGALAAAISADFGHRSLHETELLEINPVLDGIAHSLRHGAGWMRPQRRRPGFKFWPGTARLMPQPLGVAGIVVPWNYPLLLARLQDMVDEALAGGARAWPLSGVAGDARRRLFPPVALSGLAPDASVLREEIFGPVLPVLEYASLDEAIAWINARPRPLALYLFARRRATVERVLAHTTSGGVTVNDTFLHAGTDSLPFGGIGESGMGAYHGEEGFRTFSHFKPVFLRARIGLLPWLYPPFGVRAERLLRMPRR
ncbi:aldehyde dehydrogenase family protein [Massilia sp. UMI-21]|nr:aldehyde dehydrogenase family protein [Massilia sp. UMI-21]